MPFILCRELNVQIIDDVRLNDFPDKPTIIVHLFIGIDLKRIPS